MRSQGVEGKIKKHIIEYDFFTSGNTAGYIHSIMDSVRTILTSPESAILLNDLYDREFGLANESYEDSIWGPILYRDQESVEDFISYGNLLDVYMNFDIKKFFGITIDEFLDKTRLARNILIGKAKTQMEKITAQLADIEQQNQNNYEADSLNNLEEEFLG